MILLKNTFWGDIWIHLHCRYIVSSSRVNYFFPYASIAKRYSMGAWREFFPEKPYLYLSFELCTNLRKGKSFGRRFENLDVFLVFLQKKNWTIFPKFWTIFKATFRNCEVVRIVKIWEFYTFASKIQMLILLWRLRFESNFLNQIFLFSQSYYVIWTPYPICSLGLILTNLKWSVLCNRNLYEFWLRKYSIRRISNGILFHSLHK